MQPSKDRSPLRRLLASRRWRKDEPESKPAALDVAGFDRLEASLNELSKAAATQSLTYLLLWLYLAFTVASVTDYDLLIENPIKLPIFNLEIGLIAFFVAAPPLFWLVQLYMVRKLAVIGEAVNEYLAAAKQQAESAGADSRAVLERLRHRADGFVITRLLARFDDIVLPDGERGPPSSDLAAALTVLAAGATLIVAPLLLYFGFQIRFLAYQSEFITWQHRIWVLFGLMLCAAAGRTAKLSWGHTFRAVLVLLLHLIGLIRLCRYLRLPDGRAPVWVARPIGLLAWTVPVVVLGLASLTVLTFPGETMSDDERLAEWGMGGDLAKWASVPRTLTPQAVFDREAVAKALASGEKTGGLDQAGPPPLDLRHRDFSGRSLRGIDLAGAWLQGAKFEFAQLQGAKFEEARLQGATLRDAELHGAKFEYAQLQSVNLEDAELRRANLREAQLHGANLWGTQFQGASLEGAQLQGADLRLAELQGASLEGAQLQGADLRLAELQGANLSEAQLQGANLAQTAWWRARVDNTQFDNIYFWALPEGNAAPNSPEKFRPMVQKWLKYIENKKLFFHLTEEGNPNQDALVLSSIHHFLSNHSENSNPRQRANYLADTACRHEYGKWMLYNTIFRLDDHDDVSAAALSDRLKDAERCPAAQGLSRDDWEWLAHFVEWEKEAAAPRQ